jgi:hypothetical protein
MLFDVAGAKAPDVDRVAARLVLKMPQHLPGRRFARQVQAAHAAPIVLYFTAQARRLFFSLIIY